VDRGPERTPRVLDLEPQTVETVEENPSTSTWQLVSDVIIVLEIPADILNNFSNYSYKYVTLVFALTFTFTWLSLLVFLQVFAALCI
jgi:hypothetical protein